MPSTVGLPLDGSCTEFTANDLPLPSPRDLPRNDAIDQPTLVEDDQSNDFVKPPSVVVSEGGDGKDLDDDNNNSSSNNHRHQLSLEERVQELETKLQVVSRLLQAGGLQMTTTAAIRSPPRAGKQTIITLEESDETAREAVSTNNHRSVPGRMRSASNASTPHLESPAPFSTKRRVALQDYIETTDRTEENDDGLFLFPTSSATSEQQEAAAFSKEEHPLRLHHKRGISMDETVVHQNNNQTENNFSPLGSSPRSAASSGHQPNKPLDGEATSEWSGISSSDNAPAVQTPTKTHNKRNLSFRLLYASDEDDNELKRIKEKNHHQPNASSLSLSERLWLGSSILKFQQQENAAEREKERQGRSKQRRDHESSPPYPVFPSLQAPDDNVRNKWLDYLNSFQESTPDVDVQMEEFIKVPAGVENVVSFGFFICVDSFLYMITVLPIRFVWSCFLLLRQYGWPWHLRGHAQYRFHRQHLYQIIQVTILYTVYRYVLLENSIGKLYHWIRGQAMLKLYVLIAIVEVFDRLFSSLGQDCLESMYWNTVSRPRSSRMIISVLVVIIYASVHSMLLFVHVVTLHVAMNSTDQILLSLLISGNFAEIKSTVFKKYNKAALFKITASDICERFKLALFLGLVLLINMCQGMDRQQYISYFRVCGIVCGAEVIADWIKHSFITKFNFLPARVYPEYSLLLAGDVTGIGHEGVNLDHSHAVVKRIGFAQIPMVCVLFRLVREAAKYAVFTLPEYMLKPWVATLVLMGLWLGLLILKLALGSLLHRIALGKLRAAPEFSQRTPLKKKKHS